MTKYNRLTLADRRLIDQHNKSGKSISWIANALKKNKSTISRELRRGGRKRTEYTHQWAQKIANRYKSRNVRKAKIQGSLETVIQYFLFEWHCSPQQISGRLKRDFPNHKEFHVSHETLYRYVYRSPLRDKITECLRRKRKKRRRKQRPNRGGIRNKVSIHKRPNIKNRQEFGHWEGDLIIGKDQKSAMGTLVERSSRYMIIVPLKARDSDSVIKAFTQEFKKIPAHLRKSLTYDQGSEMAYHEKLTNSVGIPVYFADPGQPQQRGTNENSNGLIREYFPKKTNLNEFSEDDIKRVQKIINHRPRIVLNYASSKEVYEKALINRDLKLNKAI